MNEHAPWRAVGRNHDVGQEQHWSSRANSNCRSSRKPSDSRTPSSNMSQLFSLYQQRFSHSPATRTGLPSQVVSNVHGPASSRSPHVANSI